jgi:flagellar motor switch protein FliG
VVARISSVLQRRPESLSSSSREQRGGVRAVAALFNHLERNVGTPVLEAIESERPELAVSIRNLMFIFDDLARVDDNGLRELVQRADKKTLTIALKGASEDLRQRIFDNMSKRAAEMMREEMDIMGPVRVREVEKAQQAIVAVARQLEDEGVIVTSGEGADEYVR